MNSQKIRIVILGLLILALMIPAYGEHETRRQLRPIDTFEDHPWGGENVDPGDEPTLRVTVPIRVDSPLFLVDLMRIFILSDYTFNQDGGSDNSVLPNDFGYNVRRHNQKGQ